MFESELSSGYLFHFTKSLDVLISIIKNGFYPRCAVEDVHFAMPNLSKEQSKMGIPMVCFCDMPLNLSTIHRSQYGKYGIALSKEWGIEKGIAPVHYVIENSSENKSFIKLERFVHSIICDYKEVCKKANIPFYEEKINEDLINIMFDYIGNLKFYSENNDSKPYYDEREWRYLVPFYDGNDQKVSNRLLYDDLNDEARKKKFNDEMAKRYKITFEISDISQIILPQHDDIEKLCEQINIDPNIIKVIQ